MSGHRSVLHWEIAGAVFVILCGSLLHFVFEWSDAFRPLALIAAVNESVWEHLKLAFWPGLAWCFIEIIAGCGTAMRLLSTKGFSLLLTSCLIVVIFLSYTAILKHNYLPLDIGTFVLSVLVGQALSAGLLTRRNFPAVANLIGVLLLAAQLLAFSLLTYHPLELDLFLDHGRGLRGIPAQE